MPRIPGDVRPPTILHHMTRNAVGLPALVTIFALVAACATTPPSRAPLEAAGSEIAQARTLGAQDYAPVELSRATQQLEAAEVAFAQREHAAAERSAARAVLEAQLAQARSRAATLRESVRERADENARMRRDLLGEGTLR